MRNKVIDIHQSGKCYKAISKALRLQWTTVRGIIHKWRKRGRVVNLSRSGWITKMTPTAQQRFIQGVTKEPRTTSKELQASLPSVKVSVHDSTMRKRPGKNDMHGRVPRQKPLLAKKNMKACLTFAKKHFDENQDLYENILWTDKTKVELFGRCVSHYMWRNNNRKWASYSQSNIVVVMVWGRFAASGPEQLAVIDGTMNSALRMSSHHFMTSSWILQQDNDPEHTSRSSSEWLKKKKKKKKRFWSGLVRVQT